ncbi:RNA methyltransferase [Geobacter benzoatilyticus]|uniref:tRNA (cytidine/uridine-2'-O-)-methyltransferase TrmJ n=1 Tax=Geobacter benzoatilyticus TaxID=2815309 RepID=A0ABX7Q1F3_9BACT|nr:RNA methyltransferase [Geobacter benzoatilyticus]QSV44890.1 RNA methyltransferase [Geobacter benzoatilyticus]
MNVSIRDRIAVVLVEPQSPGNVGMVCRAMKNMGLSELRIVKGCPIDHPEAFKFAVSAKDLLETTRVFPSLEDALADTELSVATTRRHGKYRQEIFSPQEIVRKIGANLTGNRAALVFGREDSGLTTDELSLCRWHATIPTSSEYGSLNLAQAVLIFCYELFTGIGEGTLSGEARTLAGSASQEAFFGQMERTLMRIGFLNPQNPDHIIRTLRRIFSRAELDDREVTIMRGMMTQIDWATDQFRGKKGQ